MSLRQKIALWLCPELGKPKFQVEAYSWAFSGLMAQEE